MQIIAVEFSGEEFSLLRVSHVYIHATLYSFRASQFCFAQFSSTFHDQFINLILSPIVYFFLFASLFPLYLTIRKRVFNI